MSRAVLWHQHRGSHRKGPRPNCRSVGGGVHSRHDDGTEKQQDGPTTTGWPLSRRPSAGDLRSSSGVRRVQSRAAPSVFPEGAGSPTTPSRLNEDARAPFADQPTASAVEGCRSMMSSNSSFARSSNRNRSSADGSLSAAPMSPTASTISRLALASSSANVSAVDRRTAMTKTSRVHGERAAWERRVLMVHSSSRGAGAKRVSRHRSVPCRRANRIGTGLQKSPGREVAQGRAQEVVDADQPTRAARRGSLGGGSQS